MYFPRPLSEGWQKFARAWHGHRARHFQTLLGYLLAVFITHAALRFCLLIRKDAYGIPLVGKADWYIFHAFSIDFLWIFGYSLPLALLAAWVKPLYTPIRTCLFAAHSTLLLFTVLDHETLRFLGMHLDLSLLGTYGNTASIREVLHFVADDRSVRHLPYLLFFGCVPVSFILNALLRKRYAWITDTRLRGRPILILAAGAALAWLYLNVIWTGGFRMAKLRPFIQTLAMGLIRPQADGLTETQIQALAREYQGHWQALQGNEDWAFPDTAYPYYRAPSAPCQAQGSDIPGDGIDQDCDGVDAKPVNMVLLIFESHRAVNCGHLQPYGATASATPSLDSLAALGHFWTRFSVGGIPTINALMATHLSMPQHPKRYISSDFVTLSQEGFPAVLGRHGYTTRFFSAADPAWDNQTPWLRQWYQGIRYDRSRENDSATLADMATWMVDSLSPDKPFFLTVMTKTNHYPFNPVSGVRELPSDASLQERMLATMEYADENMARFFARIKDETWFPHTLFFILGDHGFPLGEHGSSTIGYGLYTESTWIPFVIVGEHPRLPEGRIASDVAGQIDIAPTLLDLAGIHDPNHYLGHSLLRPAADRGEALVLRGEQFMAENGRRRFHGPWGDQPREQGLEIFDAVQDRAEKHNILSEQMPEWQPSLRFFQGLAKLHIALLESDRIWPKSLGKGP